LERKGKGKGKGKGKRKIKTKIKRKTGDARCYNPSLLLGPVPVDSLNGQLLWIDMLEVWQADYALPYMFTHRMPDAVSTDSDSIIIDHAGGGSQPCR
jgi:hypothetical protein